MPIGRGVQLGQTVQRSPVKRLWILHAHHVFGLSPYGRVKGS